MDDERYLDEALERSLEKTGKNISRIGFKYPHVCIDSGRYNDQGPDFWVSGFWGGILWLYYGATGDEDAKRLAVRLEEGMDEVLDGFLTLHHDVGFMWLPTSVAHYKADGDEGARVRALKAASHLAGRFNLAGGFIRAWTDKVNPESQGWAIIDCMMNLPLLYWASKETGDPRFKHIAKAHTETVLRCFRREDGSYPHIVSFDPDTGEKIENLGGQGFGPDSAWARGQAWALYGMAIGARETGEKRYLDAAKDAAHFFLSHLPETKVPVWDFRADKGHRDAEDSSAAACAASGLIEISRLCTDEQDREFYLEAAKGILKGLHENYADYGDGVEAVIQKGTVHYPAGRNVNVPIIYADYFYLEALLKLKGQKGFF